MQPLPPDPLFVTSPDKKFRCETCDRVLVDPWQTSCGHHLCKPCADKVKESVDGTTRCPVAGENCDDLDETFGVFPDFGFRQELSQLKVYCDYHPCGCREEMPWKDVETHMLDCFYRALHEYGMQYCGYRGTGEDGCPFFVAQTGDDSALRKHMEVCDFRPVTCTYCQQEVANCHLKNHHDNICPDIPLPCCYGCGSNTVLRKELEAHFLVCELKPRPCSYSKMGCEFLGTQVEIEIHESEYLKDHLKLVTNHSAHLEAKCQHLEEDHQHFNQKETQWKAREGELEAVIQKKEEKEEEMKNLMNLQDNKLKHVQKYVVDQSQKIITLTDKNKETEKHLKWMESQMVRQKADLAEELNNKMNLMCQAMMQQYMCNVNKAEVASPDHVDLFDAQNGTPLGKLLQQAACSYNGVLTWKIPNYSVHKTEAANGTKPSMCSPPFYTTRQGYKMCAKVYLNGFRDHKGTHVSLFFALMKGEYDGLLSWPFEREVKLMVCDKQYVPHHQKAFCPDVQSSCFRKPGMKIVPAKEYPLHIAHEMLEVPNSCCLVEDTLYVKVVVDVRGLQPARRPLPFSDGSTDSSEELSD